VKNKVWIVIIAAVILALAGGTIAAQNILGGDANKQQKNEVPATLSGEGILVGRIDSHSVEIEIGGEPRAFGLCDALRDVEFCAGPISFKYFVDENGRSILTEAQWTKDEDDTAGAVQTAEGIFNGQADNHTVEIRVGQKDQSFTFVEGVTVHNLRTGDVIIFDYKEDENGRLVILKLEKVREAEKDDPGSGNMLSATGIFTGRIDSHSVEIKVNGEPRTFGLSGTLHDAEFAAGPISFKYYVDKNGRSIIIEADWTKAETGAVHTAEGIFNGQADNHTVEIEIGGEAKAFGLVEGISFAGIKEGEKVFIAFQQIGGRPVIIKVERIS
jgi:hypothetical protein